jgi:hypothetical protein
MKVFLSYKYGDEATESQAALVKRFIEALGLEYVDGRSVRPSAELNSQIKRLIDRSDRFLAIHNSGKITDYLKDELTYAQSKGLETIIIADTIDGISGLKEHLPLLMFKHSIQEASMDLVEELYRWRLRSIFGDEHDPDTACSREDTANIFAKLAELNLLDSTRHKRDFDYGVTLEEHDDAALSDFYKAIFTIQFSSHVSSGRLHIQSKKAENNFHRVYNELVKDKDSVYRYIIKTPAGFKLDQAHFIVTHFSVDGLYLTNPSAILDPSEVTYTYEDRRLDELANSGRKSLFYLRIETIVQKSQNEFTMIFGYPVNGLNVQFQYHDTDIESVDVVDIFTSRQDTQKSPLLRGQRQIGAQAKVVGWVLPESAVVFVWHRQPRQQAA